MEALSKGTSVFFQSGLSAMINALRTRRLLCYQKMWTTWHRKMVIHICHKLMQFQIFSKARIHQMLPEHCINRQIVPFFFSFLLRMLSGWESYVSTKRITLEMAQPFEDWGSTGTHLCSEVPYFMFSENGQILSQIFSETFETILEICSYIGGLTEK